MHSRALGTSQECRTPGPCRRVCEFIYSHLDVRGLADPKAEASLLLLAAGSGTKASVCARLGSDSLRDYHWSSRASVAAVAA